MNVPDDAAVTRKKSVLRESSGWTVIQEIAEPDCSHRTEEEVEEYDQLVEDEEYELRDEMEAEEVASIGTLHGENDQVESVAMLSGNVRPCPAMAVIPPFMANHFQYAPPVSKRGNNGMFEFQI